MRASAALACLLAASASGARNGNKWSQTNILLLRVNDDVLGGSSSQLTWIDEVSPTTGAVLSSYGPLVGTGPGQRQATLSTTYPRDGWMQRSADGRFLTFLAMDVPASSAWPNTAYSNAKVVVRVYANGTINMQTYSVDMMSGANYYLFTAVTADGTGYWVTGPSLTGCDSLAGVRYLPGDTSGVNVQVTPTLGRCAYNSRYVTIFQGQLYAAFADAGKRGIYRLGAAGGGLPTGPPAAPGDEGALLPGFEALQGSADLGRSGGNTFSTLAGFTFENATSLWLCDNGANAEWHVWWMTAPAPGGAWSVRRRVKWATVDPGYSMAGRYEASAVDGAPTWVVYSVTYTTSTSSLGSLWRYEARTGSGNGAPLAVNTRPTTKWRSAAPPPFDVFPEDNPPPPGVRNVSVSVEERSGVGTLVGAPMSAGLPAFPPLVFSLVSGHTNATGNGLANATAFAITACGGQISVAANVLDYLAQPTFRLVVKATIDDASYTPPIFGLGTVTVTVTRVPRPPQVPDPALNASVREDARPGAAIGPLTYYDREGRAPGNFTWALDAGGGAPAGAFAIRSDGVLVVGSGSGGASLLDYEAPNASRAFALGFTLTDRAAPSLVARGRALVALTDGPDPPLLAPPEQLVRFSDATAAAGVDAPAPLNVTDQDAPGSPWASPPRFALVPPAAAAAVCGTPAPSAAPPTTDGSLSPGAALFTVGAPSGLLRLVAAPPGGWAGSSSVFVFGGAFVRAAYAVCVNVSDAYAWSAGYVYAVVTAGDTSSGRPLVSAAAVTGPGGGPPLLGGAGGSEPVLDPAGGSELRLTGAGFGTAAANGAGAWLLSLTPSAAAAGRGGVPLATSQCTVTAPGTQVTCVLPPGGGTELAVSLALRNVSALFAAPVSVAYAQPVVTGLASDPAAAAAVPTAGVPASGGPLVVLAGARFGPPSLRPFVSVTYGGNGGSSGGGSSAYVCDVVDVTPAAITCRPGPGAGAGLNVSVTVAGQPARMPAAAPLTLSYAAPAVAGVQLVSSGGGLSRLDTRGGQSLLLNGTNFGGPAVPVALQLTSARVPLLAAAVPCDHSAGSPHSVVTCTTPPGLGANLSAVLVVGGQASAPAAAATAGAPPPLLSYAPPQLQRLASAGASPTAGGALFTLYASPGQGFGPPGYPGAAVDWVLYAANASLLADGTAAAATAAAALPPGVFAASDCRVASDGELTCTTAPGCGEPRDVLVSVAGQRSPVLPRTALAYAPPVVTGFSGPGAADAATAGAQAVVITGANFGDDTPWVASRRAVTLTATAPAGGGGGGAGGRFTWHFTATACNATVPHSQLTCATPPGAGRDLVWEVTLDGLASTQPTTSYARPVVTAVVAAADGVSPVTAAPASGGTVVTVVGAGFGPPGASPPLVSAVTYGPTGGEYAAANFTPLDDGRLRVVTAPGTGAGLRVRVTVAGQESDADAGGGGEGALLSYAPPAVVRLWPPSGPTLPPAGSGPALLTLTVTDAPLADASVAVLVRFGGGAGAPLLRPLALSGAANASSLAGSGGGGAVNLTVALPPAGGVGRGVPVAVVCVRGAAELASESPVPGRFSFDDPLITGAAATPLSLANASLGGGCPLPGGRVGALVCGDPALVLVSIVGANFGPDPSSAAYDDGVGRLVTLAFFPADAGSTGAAADAPPVEETAQWPSRRASSGGGGAFYLLSWAHGRVTLVTTAQRANVTLTLASPGWAGGAATNATAAGGYRRTSPSVVRVSGRSTNVPTPGGAPGDPLVLTVAGVAGGAAAWVQVTVGGSACPLLRMAGGACTAELVAPVPGTDTGLPDATARQVLSAEAQGGGGGGSGRADGTAVLCCVPPPGQGVGVPVQVRAYGSLAAPGAEEPTVSDAGSAVAVLSYAPPALAAVQLLPAAAAAAGNGTNASSSAPAPSPAGSALPLPAPGRPLPLRLPTSGGTVRLSGANLGPSPRLVTGDSAVLGAAGAPGTPCDAASAAAHSCYDFPTAEGEGDGTALGEPAYAALGGFPFYVAAGGQRSGVYASAYRSPTVTAVVPPGDATLPLLPNTRGGTRVRISGSDFGATPPLRTPQVGAQLQQLRPATPAAGGAPWNASLVDCVRTGHDGLECTLPPGGGSRLDVAVAIAGQVGVGAALLSYAPPAVANVTLAAVVLNASLALGAAAPWAAALTPAALAALAGGAGGDVANGTLVAPPSGAPPGTPLLPSGPTVGGTLLAAVGANFGPAGGTGGCVFLSWAHRPPLTAAPGLVHACNGVEDWVGEGELPAGHVLLWDHELVVFVTPPGAGLKDALLAVRGASSLQPLARAPQFRYAPPVVTSVEPAAGADTDGGTVVVVRGANFGPPARNASDPAALLGGPGRGEPGFAVPLADAPGLPASVTLVTLGRGGLGAGGAACLTNARDPLGGLVYGLPAELARCARPGQPPPLVAHTHDSLAFRMPPGVGAGLPLSVVVYDGGDVSTDAQASAPVNVSYAPPAVTALSPNPLRVGGAGAAGARLTIRGRNFGSASSPAELAAWSPEQRVLAVTVGGDAACADATRTVDPATGAVALTCVLPPTTRAGATNVSLLVAGQAAFVAAVGGGGVEPLVVGCAQGTFGRTGEVCLPCPPVGAACAGYNESAPPSTQGGVLANPDDARHTYPVPLRGFFTLVRVAAATGGGVVVDMGAACPPAVRAQYPGRDVCVVGCEPPEACLGGNVCAPGYASAPPYYRCATCDRGFYRRAGACIRCPDSPAGLFVGFIALVVAVAVAGFLLNKRQVNIAVASIGIDYFQVLAIFAQSKVAWPPPVLELFHVLSAFNLNVEIVAPECLIPDVSYKQKFAFVLLLPLCVAGLLVAAFLALAAYKKAVLGRSRRTLFSHTPALVSSLLVLTYLMYLYITRTLLDVFTCAPTVPPDGKRYLAAVFEECGVPGGTQEALLPWAVVGFVVYTAGYPAALAALLWRNRERVMEDQLLRAKGVGNDRLTNPHAYELRRKYGRSYFAFTPTVAPFWVVLVILRKFFIAVTSVVFTMSASFQMAACLLVMFCAYGLQVRFSPYMSPSDYDAVLRHHAERAFTSALHARLRAAIAHVESRGRRRTRRNVLTPGGKVDRSAVLGALGSWVFNYNTIEAVMLFAAVIVCLLGIMYQSDGISDGSYPEARDGVTSAVLGVIIVSILYWLVALVLEAVTLVTERQRAAAVKAAAARKSSSSRKLGVNPLLLAGAGAAAAAAPGGAAGRAAGGSMRGSSFNERGAATAGPVDSTFNPLMLLPPPASPTSADGSPPATPQAGGALLLDSPSAAVAVAAGIASMAEPPPPEVWRLVQAAFAEMHARLAATGAAAATAGGDGATPDPAAAGGARAAARYGYEPVRERGGASGGSSQRGVPR